jgi:hypothetical protein
LDNVDPVSGIIGAAGLILAAAAFVITGASVRTRAIVATSCVGAAVVGILIAWIGFGQSPIRSEPAPGEGAPPVALPPTGSAPATSTSASFQVLILTGSYRRTDETNSTYRIASSSSTLDFRYGWTTRTPDGDPKTDDCVVNARLVNQKDGAIIENYPSNSCQQSASKPTKQLGPGSYVLSIETARNGVNASNSKTITVLAP